MSNSSETTKKTWKREVAVVMLLGLGYVVYTENIEMVQVLVWPIATFAGAAFGLDVYSKLQSK